MARGITTYPVSPHVGTTRWRTCSLGVFPKPNLYALVAVLTEHSYIKMYATRLNLKYLVYGRSFGEEEESVEHFPCLCPDLAGRRVR